MCLVVPKDSGKVGDLDFTITVVVGFLTSTHCALGTEEVWGYYKNSGGWYRVRTRVRSG